jgi:hypothetical protein
MNAGHEAKRMQMHAPRHRVICIAVEPVRVRQCQWCRVWQWLRCLTLVARLYGCYSVPAGGMVVGDGCVMSGWWWAWLVVVVVVAVRVEVNGGDSLHH